MADDDLSSAAAAPGVEASEATGETHVDESVSLAAATPAEAAADGDDSADEEIIEAPEPLVVEYCPGGRWSAGGILFDGCSLPFSFLLMLLPAAVCTMPFEFCEFSPSKKKCLQSLQTKQPELFAELHGEGILLQPYGYLHRLMSCVCSRR